MSTYKQLEIRWIYLNPARGAETRKKRPCVVLQSDMMNRETRTVIVAPILPNHKDWPFVVNVTPTKKNGLDKDRHINLKQLRAIDISRIGNRQGLLEEHYFKSIKETIAIILGLA